MNIDVTSLRNRSARDRWNRVSMGDLFERIRWHDPNRLVLHAWPGAYENEANAALTAGRADDLANQYANTILRDISPGNIVVMVCENSSEAVLSKIGLAKAGVTIAPINPNLDNATIDSLLELCNPAGIVIDSPFKEKIAPLIQKRKIKLLHHINIEVDNRQSPSFEDFIQGASTKEPDVDISGDDIWELLFTSGSTSTPKGVMVSHHNTMYVALSFNGMGMMGIDYESDFTICSFLPIIYHVGDGLVYNAVISGGKIVIGRRFNPKEIAQAIHQYKVTCLWGGAPQAIEAVSNELTKNASLDASSVKSIIFGWAPLDPKLFDKTKSSFGQQVKLVEIIGQTEVCCAHRFWIDKHLDLYRRTAPQENYVGEPHGLLASKISTEKIPLITPANNAVGEAVYRSPSLMAGYYKKLEDTKEALRDGWFHGGDAFKWGENQQRILADRFKDIIKTGGENVTCIRVEAIINTHPAIRRAVIVGLPHKRWGEAVTAFVIINDDAFLNEPEIKEYLRSKLAPFEMPKKIVQVNSFPETVGGKVQKHILRTKHATIYEE